MTKEETTDGDDQEAADMSLVARAEAEAVGGGFRMRSPPRTSTETADSVGVPGHGAASSAETRTGDAPLVSSGERIAAEEDALRRTSVKKRTKDTKSSSAREFDDTSVPRSPFEVIGPETLALEEDEAGAGDVVDENGRDIVEKNDDQVRHVLWEN